MAIVSGPMPPGTGVIAAARGATVRHSTSPTSARPFFSEAGPVLGALAHDAPQLRRVGHAVDAHVDHHRPLPDVVGRQEPRLADRRHDNVRLPADRRQVPRPGVAQDHRGVLLQQEGRHRLADDVAAAHHRGGLPCRRDAAAGQKFHDPRRRAGHERRPPQQEAPHVEGVEAVHVLGRVDLLEQVLGVQLRGERQLQQDPVDRRVLVEFADRLLDLGTAGVRRKLAVARLQAELAAGLDFLLHVDLGGRVVSDHDRGQRGDHVVAGRHVAACTRTSFRISSATRFPSSSMGGMGDLMRWIQRPILPEPPGKINAAKPAATEARRTRRNPEADWLLDIDYLLLAISEAILHPFSIHPHSVISRIGQPDGPQRQIPGVPTISDKTNIH